MTPGSLAATAAGFPRPSTNGFTCRECSWRLTCESNCWRTGTSRWCPPQSALGSSTRKQLCASQHCTTVMNRSCGRLRFGWWDRKHKAVAPLPHRCVQALERVPHLFVGSSGFAVAAEEAATASRDESTDDGLGFESDDDESGSSIQEEALRLLEWPAICRQVAEFAATPIAVATALASQLHIGQTPKQSTQLLAETEAAGYCALSFEGVKDIRKVVAKAAEGHCCQIAELADVGDSLEAAHRLQIALIAAGKAADGQSGRLDPLLAILEPVTVDLQLAHDIRRCLTAEPALILDTASTELAAIRLRRRENLKALQQLLGGLAAQLEASGAAEEGLVVARRGRLCVAVKAARRGDIRGGITLDQSNTGVTLYVEPEEATPLNNLEIELAGLEADEEKRILRLLSSQVGRRAGALSLLLERITALDLAVARAGHAAWLNGARPTFSTVPPSADTEATTSGQNFDTLPWLDIQQIRHPLLLAAAVGPPQKRGQPRMEDGLLRGRLPVPIDIRVEDHVRVVAITGPNTGGKTATLKTLGIAALMARAGLFLPAGGLPVLPWFDAVLADVGDEQSLQQSLSTFSGHVRRLTKVLEACGPSTLVLLDEAGGGTDPTEGAALATALLKHLANTSALTVATTHYSELKALKEQDPRFENASVEFDRATLRPTYKVLWGVPGQSNALDIASALDFDADVLRAARALLGQLAPAGAGERASSLLGPLMRQADAYRTKAQQAAAVREETRQLHATIAEEAAGLAKRERRLQKAKEEEVAALIADARREMRAVVEQLHSQAAAGGETRDGDLDPYEASTCIQDIAEAYSPNRQELEDYVAAAAGARVDRASGATWQPEPGDLVLVRRLGTKPVQVAEGPDRQGNLVVVLGMLRLRVKRDELLPLARDDSETTANGAGGATTKRPSSLSQLQRAFEGEAGTSGDAIGGVSGIDALSGPGEAGPAMQTSANTVDLRGMRVDEATRALETALMHSSTGDQMYIIHGVGTGAIRQAVERLLKKHPYVKSFALESKANQGLTIAQLN